VRELDRVAIEDFGIPGIRLMKRAGTAVLGAVLADGKPAFINVFCGAGNNGGDGYIVAALARLRGLQVRLWQVSPPGKLKGDAQRAFEYAVASGVEMHPFGGEVILDRGVVVDALLGTGLSGEVRENFADAIQLINESQLPVVAVDIPSGLCSDSGCELGTAIVARKTVSFIGLKRGLFTGRGPALCGEIWFDDLDVPEAVYEQVAADVEILDLPSMLQDLPPRQRDAHKGDFGHVMVIGGDTGFGGAPMMAAEAALRCGAGLVSVATRPGHIPAILARRPEIMASAVASGQELAPLLQRPSVVVIGPGLGQSPWSEQMLQQAVKSGLPLVVDADALNIIAGGRVVKQPGGAHWVMTPHPGEAARLLETEGQQIQTDRFNAVRALQKKFSANVLLKGSGSLTLAADGDRIGLCIQGNPGMASGGMGDVLAGMIGGLMAQMQSPARAMSLAVCLHAEAADRLAAQDGQVGMAATDLFDPIRALLNGS